MIGQVFGELTVIGVAPQSPLTNKGKKPPYICVCTCGVTLNIPAWRFKEGRPIKSCGCKQNKANGASRAKGGDQSTEYKSWVHIKGRCFNPKNCSYKDYGARGITMSKEWQESFLTFLDDVGYKPGPGYSIERIDNAGNYTKDNCKWANRTEQSNNRRNNVKLTLNGVTMNATQWSTHVGLSAKRIRQRKRMGWSDERTLTTPISYRNQDYQKRK